MQNNTEQLILKAAKKHFVQNGYEGTRMQGIADEAGINKAMLHYYFRSKDKLFQVPYSASKSSNTFLYLAAISISLRSNSSW
ncbi:MAG: TetR/AcrR family transcriptional regulator, partial [Chitinophagales bacterium]